MCQCSWPQRPGIGVVPRQSRVSVEIWSVDCEGWLRGGGCVTEVGWEQTLTWRQSEDLPVDTRFADIVLDLCGIQLLGLKVIDESTTIMNIPEEVCLSLYTAFLSINFSTSES